MTPELKTTIYTPRSELRHPLRLLSVMCSDVIQSRELAWRLFVRNISARYRQTMVGYLWAILPPLLTSAIWIFLNSQKIMTFQETTLPYPLYVLVGTILWQVFVDSINAPIRVIKESAPMIAKINFPREALLFAALFEVLFNLIIQIVLLAGVFIYFKVTVTSGIVIALSGVAGIIMMGMMAGIILTPVSVLYGDIQQGIPMILQPLFYLTPIVYAVPEGGAAAVLAKLNPISPLIIYTRELITTGEYVCLELSLILTGFTFILLILGWVLYRIAMPHLVERISA